MENQEEKDLATVPFFIHEADMSIMERNNKRLARALVISLAIAVTALVVTNLAWIKHEEKYKSGLESAYEERLESVEVGD